jgi:cell division protein FtsB
MRLFLTRFAYTAVILLMASYALVALRGPRGVPGLIAKRQQIQEMEKRNAVLAREIEQKRARIARLKDDRSLQDQEIRDRLKLVKPDEKVFILQDAK